jgi:3-hydroxybutyryl-CoA dehydrogenase
MIKNVTVIGAGTMGNGIAHVFAQHGFRTYLFDIAESSLQKARVKIETNLDRMLAKGSINEEVKSTTLANLHTGSSMEEACKDADLVVEAATEKVELKLDIFTRLDALCKPGCILASNTSSIPITRIAAVTSRPEYVIGMHFMNPVPIMKLVEVIRGYLTSAEVCKIIMDLSVQLSKTPTEVNDYPGFISNRILMPMINEAICSLFEGVAGVSEIDTVMKLGMAHPMGPLQLADFIGLDTCLSILRVLYDGFGNPKYAPCPLLVNMVTSKQLGVKSGAGFYLYDDKGKPLQVSPRFRNLS